MAAHVEYLGFTPRDTRREYRLQVRNGGSEPVEFVLWIPNEAFLSRRVRYQDAPEICFLKLQRELLACPDGLLGMTLRVTDADLEEYRIAHSPAPRAARPKTQPAAG